MKIPEQVSPYNLLQEQLKKNAWRMLVAVIMLNKTSAVQVKNVIWKFFEKWPNAWHLVQSPAEEIAEAIKPLGLYNRRAETLLKMSKRYIEGFNDVKELPGIGKYGADSYEMFVLGNVVEDVEDKELKNYVNWVKEGAGGSA